MKKNILTTTLIVSILLIQLSSCKRDYKLLDPVQTTDGYAYLAIIDASPNFRSIYNLPDSFNVFINGNKISGFTPGAKPPVLTFGGTFPSTTTGFGYVAIPAGEQNIKLSVPGVHQADSIAITTFKKSLEANKQYTFMITDNISSSNDSSQIFVEDQYTFPPTRGYYNLRFIDAVTNDTAAVDLFSYAKNSAIFTNIAPGGLSAFTQVGANLQTTDTLYVTRAASSKVPLSARTILAKMAFQGGDQKSYTIYMKGDFKVTTKTDPKYMALTFYRHQ